MTIKRHIFDVEYLDDPAATPREFRVRVILADKADAEVYGPQHGVVDPRQQPQTVGLLWLWFAARREGHVPEATTFVEFRARCLDNAAAEDEPVTPTSREAHDDSLSTSADASPALLPSTAGSTASPSTSN